MIINYNYTLVYSVTHLSNQWRIQEFQNRGRGRILGVGGVSCCPFRHTPCFRSEGRVKHCMLASMKVYFHIPPTQKKNGVAQPVLDPPLKKHHVDTDI